MQESQQVTGPPQVSHPEEPPTPCGRSVHHLPQSGEPPAGGGRGIPALNSAPSDISQHQLSVALTWVRRGVPVIPCSRKDKAPLDNGFGRDVSDQDVLRKFGDPEATQRRWTGRNRRDHVGILTGRGAGGGLVVIDLDMRKDGTEIEGRWADVQGGTDVLEALAAEAGADWPDTYTVLTPSGGLHLYFRQPQGERIGCATGDGEAGPHLGPLVDVRGVGGLVIAAGSYSPAQGRPYERVSAPEVLPQELPEWLLTLLRRRAPERPRTATPVSLHGVGRQGGTRVERYAAAALRGAAADLAALREGDHRRDRTYAAAARLGELAATAPHILTESAVREQLLAAALACGIKGGQRQAEKCIRNGWEQGLSGRGAGAA